MANDTTHKLAADSRNYGYARLSGLIHGIGLFDVEERQFGNAKQLYVRARSKAK